MTDPLLPPAALMSPLGAASGPAAANRGWTWQLYSTAGASPSSSAAISPSAKVAKLKPVFFKPGLVIFDKDGTLVCFHTMWTPWCHSLANRWGRLAPTHAPICLIYLVLATSSRMKSASGRHDLTEDLYDVLGYDHVEQRVRIGALAENTHPQIKDMIQDMLQKRVGFTPSEARFLVNTSWKDTPEDLEIK